MNKKIKEAFNHVTAETELKQRTEDAVIQYMRKQSEEKRTSKFTQKRTVGLALTLIFMFVFSGLFVYQQPVSAISVVSTSSVEVYLNRFNRVVEVIHYDENGNAISEEHNLQHKSFDEAMEEILKETDSEDVYITVASQNEETTAKLTDNLSRHQEMMQNMQVFQSSEAIMRQARESGTPMGRMHVMHELERVNEDYSNRELEKESTQELMETFERHHREMMEGEHMKRPSGPRNGGHMQRRR